MGFGIIVCIFIMLVNLLVMVVIYVNCCFYFFIYYLMVNLVVVDFFVGLVYFYFMFNIGFNIWRLIVSIWFFCQGFIDISLMVFVVNLLVIVIERYIMVFCMQFYIWMSNWWVVVVIVVIWIMVIIMGVIFSVGWNCICDIENCFNMVFFYSDFYLVFWVIFNLVIFVVMVVFYVYIFGYVCQRIMRMFWYSFGFWWNWDIMMSFLKIVVIVFGVFIICWIFGLVLLFLDVCCLQCDVLVYEKFFFFLLNLILL